MKSDILKKNLSFFMFFSICVASSCNYRFGPTSASVWEDYKYGLKGVVADIFDCEGSKYSIGRNELPDEINFDYYNDFYIYSNNPDSIQVNELTVVFYTDKGLLDHYSAIIFTNDSTEIFEYEGNVLDGGNDFKLESNWFLIND